MKDREDISSPARLEPDHDLDSFDSGVAELDVWLKRRARTNDESGASRTYVVCSDKRVIGYYAIASGSVSAAEATGRARRNMPDPVPVMVLGRLAVDKAYQGKGIGQGMLRDAVLRILQAAEIGGIRAILVHAISEEARLFYLRHGFSSSPVDSMTLMITISDVKKALL